MPPRNKYYIAGPMSNKADYNAPAFEAAAADLRNRGCTVVSPVDIAKSLPAKVGALPYEVYARESLRGMLDCNNIVLLKGFRDSKGAMAELNVAHYLQFKIWLYEGPDNALKPHPKLGLRHV